MRGRVRATIAALAAGVILGAGGCGSDEGASVVTPVEVTRLEASLDEVRSAAGEGDRAGALAALRQFRTEIEQLDADTEEKAQLRTALLIGAQRAKVRISKELPP